MDTEAIVAALVVRAEHVEVRLLAIETKLDGPRGSGSVRDRLHALEGESQAARVASEALAQARAERRKANQERIAAGSARRSWRLKTLSAILAIVLGVYPYLAHFAGW